MPPTKASWCSVSRKSIFPQKHRNRKWKLKSGQETRHIFTLSTMKLHCTKLSGNSFQHFPVGYIPQNPVFPPKLGNRKWKLKSGQGNSAYFHVIYNKAHLHETLRAFLHALFDRVISSKYGFPAITRQPKVETEIGSQ